MRPLNIYNASAIVTAGVYAIIAFFLYTRRRQWNAPAIKKFVASCSAYSIYCLSIFLLFAFYNDFVSALGTIMLVVGAFVPTLLCDFLLTLANARRDKYRLIYIFPVFFIALSIYQAFSFQLIDYQSYKFFPPHLIIAIGVPAFFLLLIIYTWICFSRRYKEVSSTTQLRFMRRLFGGVFLFIPAAMLDILFIAVRIGVFPFSLPMLIGYMYQIIHVLDLETTNRNRLEYVTSLAHELKTPLTPIWIIVDELEHDPALSPETKEALRVVSSETERLRTLVDNLYLVSSLELELPGSIKLTKEYSALDKIAFDIVALLHYAAEQRGIRLTYRSDDCLPEIPVDRDLIKQALSNLINNAMKYTPYGGKIHVEVFDSGANIYVSVEDTGIGIAEEELPFIFDRFYRSKNAGGISEGSGLGLASAKFIMESHGGAILVESKQNKGSKFILALPKKDPSLSDTLCSSQLESRGTSIEG